HDPIDGAHVGRDAAPEPCGARALALLACPRSRFHCVPSVSNTLRCSAAGACALGNSAERSPASGGGQRTALSSAGCPRYVARTSGSLKWSRPAKSATEYASSLQCTAINSLSRRGLSAGTSSSAGSRDL